MVGSSYGLGKPCTVLPISLKMPGTRAQATIWVSVRVGRDESRFDLIDCGLFPGGAS